MSKTTGEARNGSATESGRRRPDDYEVLADSRRQSVTRVLTRQATPIQLAPLAAAVATLEEAPDETAQNTIRLELHHKHLPMMEDAGILTYDAEEKRVIPHTSDLNSWNV